MVLEKCLNLSRIYSTPNRKLANNMSDIENKFDYKDADSLKPLSLRMEKFYQQDIQG